LVFGTAYNTNITEIKNVVKSGPLFGIWGSYMGPYIKNTTILEWKEFIHKEDSILIVDANAVGTSDYLYQDVIISTPSTICTPTYSERILDYWSRFPEKYPDVILVSCWYGELKVPEDSWIMNWINTEFQPNTVTEGKYWRYYRKINDSM
jgi:hypothetical protein